MSALFKKLNLGTHRTIHVWNAPASFEVELAALADVVVVRDPATASSIGFALAFVQSLAQVEASTQWLPKVEPDAVIWMAYPKQTSKRYTCEFNRDNGWAVLGALGYEGVRMVAIDADWSALRFRKASVIKSLKRDPSRAISKTGQARTKKK
jgi:hypothetical protein